MRADRLVAVKEEEAKNPIDKALASRQRTYKSIYCDIGTALGAFSTSELAEYYIQRFGDSALRYFLEQGIIAAEISKEKEEHRIKCWQGDVNDWHNREGIVDLYYKDISTYVLKMRGVENYQIDKKLLKQIKNKIVN